MGTSEPLTAVERTILVETARDRYGLDIVEIDRLGGELDLNFRAVDGDGTRWFLRLTPTPTDLSTVAWQNSVLRQLEADPPSVEVPRLIAQTDGADFSPVALGENRTFLIRVTTWVPGGTVAELGATDHAFRLQIGRLAAEIVERLAPLASAASTPHDHHWAVVASGDAIRSTMDAAEPARRRLLAQALDWFTDAEDRLPQLPQTVVHQDLHDFNLLAVTDPTGPRLTGVVDFNDAVRTARVAELAVAAAYATLRQPEAVTAFVDVVEGYLQHAELTDLELELLYPLGVARLAVNASTWTQRSARSENGEYARARMAATWPSLEQLLRVDPRQITARLRALPASVRT